ncbi:MAG: hypothetical protein KF716_27920 [Anaerolineae bacterium]|nr:hypothetical protein [Anaerolineae bacterium]
MRLQIVSKLDHPDSVTQIGGGMAASAVLGVVMIGLVGMALLLPPFSIVQRWQQRGDGTALTAGAQAKVLGKPPSTAQATDSSDLPITMSPISTTYRLTSSDTDSNSHSVQLSVNVPEAYRASAVDIAVWAENGWRIVPSARTEDAAQRTATVVDMPSRVALVQLAQITPLMSVLLEPGQVLRPEMQAVADVVQPAGMTPDASGNLTGLLPNGIEFGQGYAVLPLIRCEDGEMLTRLLTDQALQTAHLNALVDFATSQPYAGLALDYRGVTADLKDDYTAFLHRLAERLAMSKRTLTVMLTSGEEAYDWGAIGQLANAVQVRLSSDAVSFSGIVNQITSQISRAKLQIILTSDVADVLVSQLAIVSAANLAGVGVAAVAVEGDTSTVARVITPYKLPMLSGQH